jgi:hypothetical protein
VSGLVQVVRGWLADRFSAPAWSLAALPALVGIGAFAWVLSSSVSLSREVELGSIKSKHTFLSKNDGWCRQFEVTQSSSRRFSGVACRTAEGEWRLVAQAPLPSLRVPSTGTYSPAQGNEAPAVESAVDKMIVGDPIAKEEEQQRINRGWSKP